MRLVLVSFVSFLSILLLPTSSVAGANRIQHIAVQNLEKATEVRLQFESSVVDEKWEPIYERNFVQLALKGTRLNSAKVIPVHKNNIEKVFAYSYAPDVTRVRIFLNGQTNWAQGHVFFKKNGKRNLVIRIELEGRESKETQTVPGETEVTERKVNIHDPQGLSAALKEISDKREEQLKTAVGADRNVASATGSSLLGKDSSAQSVTGYKNEAKGPWRQFGKVAIALLGILGLFGGLVFGVRTMSTRIKGLPFNKKERIIQVVATHYLGSKKSISLVKVTGEYFVVGVSNDNISLLSKLGAEVNVDRYLEDRFWGGTFEKHLNTYAKDTTSKNTEVGNEREPVPFIGSSESIRNSIKEKVIKLKQL